MRAIKKLISIRAAYLSMRRVAWYPAQLGKSRSKGRRPPSCPPSLASPVLTPQNPVGAAGTAKGMGTKEHEAPTSLSLQPIPTAFASVSRQSEPRPYL